MVPKNCSNLGDSESDSHALFLRNLQWVPLCQVARHNAFALGNGMGEIAEESGEGLVVEALMRPLWFLRPVAFFFYIFLRSMLEKKSGKVATFGGFQNLINSFLFFLCFSPNCRFQG